MNTSNIQSFIVFSSCKNQTVEIFVTQFGKPDNDGRKEVRFSDLNLAIEKANQIKSEKRKTEIVINLLPGEYHLIFSISINSSLNGLKIIGSTCSNVTVKGSVSLNLSWEKTENEILVSKVAEDINFDQFVVND